MSLRIKEHCHPHLRPGNRAVCLVLLVDPRPSINTLAYEQGLERMPFQGRLLIMLPMRWAHDSAALHRLTQFFAISHFWFPRPVAPEVLVQAAMNVACLLLAGFF